MRILAIDHGSKRIGIAVSDELKMIAQPLEYILAEPSDKFMARLNELICDKEVEMIVSAFDAVMAESAHLGGHVWSQSVQLIKHALGG